MASACSPVASQQSNSWVNIIKGQKDTDEKGPVRPAARGSLLVRCRGEFLVMLGHYGWIMSLQPIDHPDANKHGGRIYINKKDIRARSEPKTGDEVMFSLYVDDSGLGAEDCYVVGEAADECCEAEEFTWINQKPIESDDEPELNPNAKEFTPMFSVPAVQESFDWNDNSSWDEANLECQPYNGFETKQYHAHHNRLDAFALNLDSFDDSDDESDTDDERIVQKSKIWRDDNSTRAGDSSDSESEPSYYLSQSLPVGPPPGLEAPPGLEFIGTLEPPPGLDLPAEVLHFNRLMLAAA